MDKNITLPRESALVIGSTSLHVPPHQVQALWCWLLLFSTLKFCRVEFTKISDGEARRMFTKVTQRVSWELSPNGWTFPSTVYATKSACKHTVRECNNTSRSTSQKEESNLLLYAVTIMSTWLWVKNEQTAHWLLKEHTHACQLLELKKIRFGHSTNYICDDIYKEKSCSQVSRLFPSITTVTVLVPRRHFTVKYNLKICDRVIGLIS